MTPAPSISFMPGPSFDGPGAPMPVPGGLGDAPSAFESMLDAQAHPIVPPADGADEAFVPPGLPPGTPVANAAQLIREFSFSRGLAGPSLANEPIDIPAGEAIEADANETDDPDAGVVDASLMFVLQAFQPLPLGPVEVADADGRPANLDGVRSTEDDAALPAQDVRLPGSDRHVPAARVTAATETFGGHAASDPLADLGAPRAADVSTSEPAADMNAGDNPQRIAEESSRAQQAQAAIREGRALADAARRARIAERFGPHDDAFLSTALNGRSRTGGNPSAQAAALPSSADAMSAPAQFPVPHAVRQVPETPSVAGLPPADPFSGAARDGAPADSGSGSSADRGRQAGADLPAAIGGHTIHVGQPASFDKALVDLSRSSQQGSSASRIPDEGAVASSIVQAMRLQWHEGVGTAIVNLKPDYLGSVSIALRIEAGAVTATLQADDPHVRAWIEENEPLLRQGLSQQGLSLERLVVSDDRPAEERGPHDGRRPRDEQEPRPRTPRRPQDGTFEIVV